MKKPLPTIKEIARTLNISSSTVSRALHDHHSIGLRTKARVQELAKQLKYEPNQTEIFFKQRKTFCEFCQSPICHYMEKPPLASVEQFPYEQGKKAAVILWQLLDDTEDALKTTFQVMLESKLMMHSSIDSDKG